MRTTGLSWYVLLLTLAMCQLPGTCTKTQKIDSKVTKKKKKTHQDGAAKGMILDALSVFCQLTVGPR